MIHSKALKEMMQHELNELRQKDVFSTQIFRALASNRRIPTILQSLQDGKDVASVAHLIESPSTSDFVDYFSFTPSDGSPRSPDGAETGSLQRSIEEVSTLIPRRPSTGHQFRWHFEVLPATHAISEIRNATVLGLSVRPARLRQRYQVLFTSLQQSLEKWLKQRRRQSMKIETANYHS